MSWFLPGATERRKESRRVAFEQLLGILRGQMDAGTRGLVAEFLGVANNVTGVSGSEADAVLGMNSEPRAVPMANQGSSRGHEAVILTTCTFVVVAAGMWLAARYPGMLEEIAVRIPWGGRGREVST